MMSHEILGGFIQCHKISNTFVCHVSQIKEFLSPKSVTLFMVKPSYIHKGSAPVGF